MKTPLKLIIASTNHNKIKEIKDVLKDLNLCIQTLKDYPDIPEIEENGQTFDENATIKSKTVYNYTGECVLADDSGLEVLALCGKPGIYSSRFAHEQATDKENNQKLLELLNGVPLEKRTAFFRCSMAIIGKPSWRGSSTLAGINTPGMMKIRFLSGAKGKHDKKPCFHGKKGELFLARGSIEGQISEGPRGDKGFGYDPLFIVKGYGKTFGELGEDVKNKISHRALALKNARNILNTFMKKTLDYESNA